MSLEDIKKGEFLVFLIVLLIPVLILWITGLFISSLIPTKPIGIRYILIPVPIVAVIVARKFSSYIEIRFKDVIKPNELQLLVKILSLSFVSLTGNVIALIFLMERNSFLLGTLTLLITLLGGIWLLFYRSQL